MRLPLFISLLIIEKVGLSATGPPILQGKGQFARKGTLFCKERALFCKERTLFCNDGQDVSGCMALIVSYPRHNTFEESPFQGQFGNDKELASA